MKCIFSKYFRPKYTGTVIFLSLVIQTILSAQQLPFENVPSSNELSSNSVYAILKDREGFLWVGTQNGLNRYDGERYTAFVHQPDDSTSLSDSFIITLAEDSSGNIWVGTRHGLNRFDKRTQSFRRFYLLEHSVNATHQTIYSIACASDGSIFAATASKLFVISPAPTVTVSEYGGMDSVTAVAFDDHRSLFIGKPGSIEIVDTSGNVTTIRLPVNATVNAVLRNRDRFFAATDLGLVIIRTTPGKKGAVRHQTLLHGISVIRIAVDQKQRIWAATDSGMFLVERNGERHRTGEEFAVTASRRSNSIHALLSDNTGMIWAGMVQSGIQRYDLMKENFRTVPLPFLGKKAIVWSILQDRSGVVWVGTDNGVYRFFRGDTLYRFPKPFLPAQFGRGMVGTIKEDRDGNVWISKKSGDLFRYSPSAHSLRTFRIDDAGNRFNVADICEGKDGTMWVATTNGLFSFDRNRGTHRKAPIDDRNVRPFTLYGMHLMESSDGHIWLSATHGIYRYDPRSGTSVAFHTKANDSSSISFNITGSSYEDRRGRLWVTTLGGGFNRFHPETGTFTRFTSSRGLVNDVVYGMLEESGGTLWMSTDQGLSRFDPQTEKFISYGKDDGVQIQEFAQNAFYRNTEGKMFFGGVGGMVVFQPESIAFAARPAPVVVTDIRIDYQSILPGHPAIVNGTLTTPEEIHLTYEQKALSIDFTTLNFRSPGKSSFSYRMVGFFDDWVYPSVQQRTAHYTHLPSGEYLFEVRTSMQKGEWENGLRIRIVMHPPFWERWWFILLSSAAVLGSIIFSVRYISQRNLKQRLREVEMQQKVHAERERISRDLHDSTGSSIAGIISGLDLAERYLATDTTKTKRTLESLTKEARASMGQLRETILALKTEEMSLDDFADAAAGNVKKLLQYRKRVGFQLLRNYPQGIVLSSIQTLQLMRILEEAVSNAVTHAAVKQIELVITNGGGELTVMLRNDGKKKTKRHSSPLHGNGLPNMRRRTEEMGGTFLFESDDVKGSSVTIIVPLNKRP